MADSFQVRIAKEEFIFSAAHFITYAGNICERLHGHNYGVAAVLSGPLDENHYVIDFIAVRNALKAVTQSLDHHVLLPTNHTMIQVTTEGKEVTATFADRRWIFPAEDCILLPIANTTAELLARFIGEQLLEKLDEQTAIKPLDIQIEVDECAGQVGIWHHQPG
tara:strand:+ start:196 stop:687 length:492 start_codon:yes stop_codon:yes gene_type:complete